MSNKFLVPKKILSGKDALLESGESLATFGNKACIISDNMMVTLGNTDKLGSVLETKGIAYAVYDGISGEPTDEMVNAGVNFYKENECDFLIGIGGGSPIDAMKAIAVGVVSGEDINSFYQKPITFEVPSMVAIPTTAGTGSEATQFTIITNTKDQIKMLLRGESLIPDLAILESSFIQSAPKHILATTGIDALCHAVESYTSKKAQPLAQSFSISAIKRILENLPKLMEDQTNDNVAQQMSLAALEAGIAFNNSSVTIIHGMSRPIGALFHIPHGASNAMLFETCMRFASKGEEELFGELANAVGFQHKDRKVASKEFLDACYDLIHSCELRSLKETVSQEDFEAQIDKMAIDAMASGSPQNTMKDVTIDDVKELYQQFIESRS